MVAGETYLTNPMETPFLPSWNRVNAASPDFLARYAEAVRLDNASD
jgi:glucosyl-3-phosphoglycerate synthase